MKQVCLICSRTGPQGTLYCQDQRCQAERAPILLNQGNRFDDLEIIAPLTVLPTSIIYEACRGNDRVLLKIAHPSNRAIERLKREATFLNAIRDTKGHAPDGLPTLLGPYPGTNPARSAYGSTMLGGQLLYFTVFTFFAGEPLRAFLSRNAQPWVNHAGWIAHGLARTVGVMHSRGLLHLALCPEAVLLRFEPGGVVPDVLLVDLGLVTTTPELAGSTSDYPSWQGHWHREFVPPGYTAPELFTPAAAATVGYATDVYEVGLILYEMLIGRPAFPAARLNDTSVEALVREGRLFPMTRVLDAKELAAVATTAVSRKRFDDLRTFDRAVLDATGPIPPVRRSLWQKVERPMFILAIVLSLAFLIAFMLDVLAIAAFF